MATTPTPIHPGEVLLADFLEPFGLSPYRLARDIAAILVNSPAHPRGRDAQPSHGGAFLVQSCATHGRDTACGSGAAGGSVGAPPAQPTDDW